MKRRFVGLPILFCVLLFSCKDARIKEEKKWGEFFAQKGINDACFMLRDHAHDAVHYYNLKRDTMHVSPASTFKIVLALAGLETGVLRDHKFVIPWNGQPSGKAAWEKDMDLREAFVTSSEPYFHEVARRLGRERLQHFLDTLNYGNKHIGDSVHRCWVDGSLLISADEQLGLMKRLYFNELPLTDRTQRIVRSIMLQQDEQGRKLYYKTGWGRHNDNNLLWVVGFAEYEKHVQEQKGSMNKSSVRDYVYFFAQHFEIPKSDTSDRAKDRMDLLKQILTEYVGRAKQ